MCVKNDINLLRIIREIFIKFSAPILVYKLHRFAVENDLDMFLAFP